ncbi:MAG: pyridoxal-phosphate-dependent aminotransferase family protein [Candidatus Zixiibacteriota bacterium]
MHKKLMIPGPTEVLEDRLLKMATPMIGHRMAEYSELQKSVIPKLQKALYTENKIIVGTCSGSGLMEAATRNMSKKKILGTNCGAFSKRWTQIAKKNGKDIDVIEVEWGKHVPTKLIDEKLATGEYDLLLYTHNETSTGVMNPIEEVAELMKTKYPDVLWAVDAVSSMMGAKLEVDKLGVDFILASMQKAFALPPGFAIGPVSDRALEYAETVPDRGHYFDFKTMMSKYEKWQTPITPSIAHLYALDYQMTKIIEEEGLDNRWQRHIDMAEYVRDWAKKYFGIFAEEGYESLTVTCVENTRGIDVKDLSAKLGERGYAFANGYGNLKGKTFRIAHMGDVTLGEIKNYLSTINDILGLC